MGEMSAQAVEIFSGHLRCLEEGRESDFEVLCGEHGEMEEELRQLLGEWERMSEVLERLGPKQGTLSLQLRERYGAEVDPGISLSAEEEDQVLDESSAALMSKLSQQGGSERYQARGEIARGGMGAILKVWDEDLRRPLAMKVALREDGGTTGAATDATSQKRLSRFLEEAQITSQLDHPGIVPVHDLGIDAEGRVFFTMQLVDGRDMRAIVELAQKGEEGWDLRRLVGVLIRVCEALAYAHAKGVVHRDIKPGNVMVGKFGEVFVMDWGLAKVMGREEELDPATSTIIHTLRSDGSSAEHTIIGDVVGTPAFMAPEQAFGRGAEVGPASDLYAVGAMLYLMLTGQIPYQPLGETVSALAILDAVKAGSPWPIRKVNPDAPPELIAVCEKAMQREVPDRFGDAMELGGELRNWLEGNAVTTYETGLFYGLRKWVGRNKGMAGALLGLVVVVLGGLGVLFQQQQRSIESLEDEQLLTKEAQTAAEANEEQAVAEAERANEEAERANEEATRANEQAALLLESKAREMATAADRRALAEKNRSARYRAQVIAAWFSLRLSEAEKTRQRLSEADEDLRGWEWGHLNLGSDDVIGAPIAHANGSLDLACVGEQVVSMGSDAVVRVLDAGDWSHDDVAVRYGIPTIGARVVKGRNVCALSVKGVLATVSQSAVVLLWDVATMQLRTPLAGAGALGAGAEVVMGLAFSADGEHLATVGSGGLVRVWSVGAEEVVWETDLGGALNCVAFHPLDPQVVVGARDGSVEIWRYGADGGKRLGGFVEEHKSEIHDVAYSHDGELLACAGEDGEVQLWDRVELEALELDEEIEVSSFPGLSSFPALNEQIQKLAQRAREIMRISADPKLRLRGHRQGATCLLFSWDDRVVYAGGSDGTVRAWSAMDGSEQGVWDGHSGGVTGLVMMKEERILSGALDGTLRVFDPYWDATRQQIGSAGGGPVLFVAGDAQGRGVLALSAEGALHRERPEEALGAAGALATASGRWACGALVGEHIALAGGDELVWLVHPESGEVLRTLDGHDAEVVDIAADAMGYRMITGSTDKRAMVWEGVDPLEDLESWSIMHGRGVVAVAISADARVVATADKDRTLRMWDAEERTPLQVWSAAHRWQSTAIAVGPEGERVASASRTEVSVFQVGEKERVTQLGPHKAEVTTVAFHGDGERLVTGDADGGLYLWDVEGAEVLMEWRGHEAAVTSVAFVDEGETLVSGDADGVVYAWRSDRSAGRYERWEEHARTPLRLEGILRSFGGDLELARAGLLAGVGGLSSADPAVLRLLEILEPGEEESVGGE